MQVGPADTARRHPDEQFIPARRRDRALDAPQRPARRVDLHRRHEAHQPFPDPIAGRAVNGVQVSKSCYPRTGLSMLIRSEEHRSELQSLMLNSYTVFVLNKKIIFYN